MNDNDKTAPRCTCGCTKDKHDDPSEFEAAPRGPAPDAGEWPPAAWLDRLMCGLTTGNPDKPEAMAYFLQLKASKELAPHAYSFIREWLATLPQRPLPPPSERACNKLDKLLFTTTTGNPRTLAYDTGERIALIRDAFCRWQRGEE